MYMSRIRGPYVRFCERDEAVTPHPTRYGLGEAPTWLMLSRPRAVILIEGTASLFRLHYGLLLMG